MEEPRRLTKVSMKVAAAFVAAIMTVCMMPAAALSAAYAEDGISPQTSLVEGWDISFNNQTVTVEAGQQVDMSTYIKGTPTVPPGDTGHVDYFIDPASSLASINKHTGILTANGAGTVTVKACLVKGEAKQVQGLCGEEMAYATKDVTITAAPDEYGFQGGSNAIHMLSPEVDIFSGNLQSGFVNRIYEANSIGGYVYFTYETTTGFTNYDSPEAYTKINSGQITLTANGKTYSLGDPDQAILTVSSLDSAHNQVTVRVAATYAKINSGTLTFHPDLRGNSDKRFLETTVSFNFDVM